MYPHNAGIDSREAALILVEACILLSEAAITLIRPFSDPQAAKHLEAFLESAKKVRKRVLAQKKGSGGWEGLSRAELEMLRIITREIDDLVSRLIARN